MFVLSIVTTEILKYIIMSVKIRIKESKNLFSWSNRSGNIGAEAVATRSRLDPNDENSRIVYHVNRSENMHLNTHEGMVSGFIELEDAEIV